jgi:hypothetical protein
MEGKTEGNQTFLDKSFKPEASNNTPTTKSKITTGDIVKVIVGIVTITLAVLKGCHVI